MKDEGHGSSCHRPASSFFVVANRSSLRSSFILHPSSFILPRPSSFILHPSARILGLEE
ncbi:MAG: hypothetical protein ACXW5U_19885 [Thermoanaerobaculia bacterium]